MVSAPSVSISCSPKGRPIIDSYLRGWIPCALLHVTRSQCHEPQFRSLRLQKLDFVGPGSYYFYCDFNAWCGLLLSNVFTSLLLLGRTPKYLFIVYVAHSCAEMWAYSTLIYLLANPTTIMLR